MRKVVVVAVAIAVAAAVVWWLRREPAAPAKAAHDSPRGERADLAAGGARGSDAPPDDQAPLISDDPHGTLRLEGQVVEGTDDHPVPGAVVTIDAHPVRTTTTDAGGNFAFDALVGRPYVLVAHAAAGVAGPVTARLTATSEPVILHLRTAATLAVTVTGPGGTTIPGATVELRGLDEQRAQADANGVAAFPSVIPGGYTVAGWADGLAHAYLRMQVTKGANQARLALLRGAAVTGKVVDERGKPISGASVAYTAAGEFGGFGARRRDAATSASDGTFRFDALPAGTFRFEGSHPEYAPGVSSAVSLDGVHEHGDIVVTMSDGAIVKGRVVDAGHQPVGGARVRVGEVGGPGRGGFGNFNAGPPREGYTGIDGTFEIHGLPKHGLVAIALHETGASHDVQVDATRGDVSGIELVLDVTGAISGLVVDQDNQPIEGAQVSARPSFDGSGAGGGANLFAAFRMRGLPQELTDGSGKFTLRGLAPGNYSLSASRDRASRGRRGPDDGVIAKVGDTDVKIVLQPEGGVKGTVALTGGGPPSLFTVVIGPIQQSFPSGGAFEVDDIPPGNYQLDVRGPEFQTKSVAVEIDPGKVADIGAIAVMPGRTLSGIVLANNQPVPNATVYGGHTLMGIGTANAQNSIASQFNAAVKQTDTGSDGTFALSGFDDGDLSVVAERTDIGRSAPVLAMDGGSNANSLVLTIVPYGQLSGTLTQGGAPAGGIVVTCQSVATPGVLYTAPSADDGTYAFTQLAADTYKVSATLREGRRGSFKFFSQQATVPSGGAVTVNLTADTGSITLDVDLTAGAGSGVAAMAYLASQPVTAATARDLIMAMAALGQSTSAQAFTRNGELPFTELFAGAYTVCAVPFPAGMHGGAGFGYLQQHAAQMPAFCAPVNVAASPATQAMTLQVTIPPMLGSGG
jgi:protocatechuate 3,4-dioxygenase beta subunit